jgi:apolipoprotein D and lipocalin family protein
LDHSFERGMSSVTATYSMRDDGGVKVLNKGFKEDSQEWGEAEGKAYFVDSSDVGHLKVSFFGPFYGSYIIFELDTLDYQYAFVSGMNTDYLWLLARTPAVSDELIEHFVKSASALGFDTEQLIFVDQSKSY